MTAFTPEGVHYDSSQANGAIVEHTTSWLTVNPYKGCSLGCAYCFRAHWQASNEPVREYAVDRAIADLIAHPSFVPNDTPVSINVSSTDAFLPEVKESTFAALHILESHGLRNPVGLTTKLPPSRQDIERLTSLRFIQPIIFVSLAFLPRNIEPLAVQPRIRGLRRLKDAGLPAVLYYRPIIPGINDSSAIIDQALILGQRYCEAICVGGLRLSSEIAIEMMRVGAPRVSRSRYDFHTKTLPEQLGARLSEAHSRLRLSVPIYEHTSCAVSLIMRRQNYNQLYNHREVNCSESCPSHQQARCSRGRG